jgi:hypothetical protein
VPGAEAGLRREIVASRAPPLRRGGCRARTAGRATRRRRPGCPEEVPLAGDEPLRVVAGRAVLSLARHVVRPPGEVEQSGHGRRPVLGGVDSGSAASSGQGAEGRLRGTWCRVRCSISGRRVRGRTIGVPSRRMTRSCHQEGAVSHRRGHPVSGREQLPRDDRPLVKLPGVGRCRSAVLEGRGPAPPRPGGPRRRGRRPTTRVVGQPDRGHHGRRPDGPPRRRALAGRRRTSPRCGILRLRRGAVAARRAHNPKVVGSNPTAAITPPASARPLRRRPGPRAGQHRSDGWRLPAGLDRLSLRPIP